MPFTWCSLKSGSFRHFLVTVQMIELEGTHKKRQKSSTHTHTPDTAFKNQAEMEQHTLSLTPHIFHSCWENDSKERLLAYLDMEVIHIFLSLFCLVGFQTVI